jgi:hypothetical protein
VATNEGALPAPPGMQHQQLPGRQGRVRETGRQPPRPVQQLGRRQPGPRQEHQGRYGDGDRDGRDAPQRGGPTRGRHTGSHQDGGPEQQDDGDRPQLRRERGDPRKREAEGPAAPPTVPGRVPGQDRPAPQEQRRQRHVDHDAVEPTGGQRARQDRQQGPGEGRPAAQERSADDPAGRRPGHRRGERHRAQQQQVHRRTGPAQQRRGERGEDRQPRLTVGSGVGGPQVRRAARSRQQPAALERAAPQQRPLGEQRQRPGEHDEHHARPQEQPPLARGGRQLVGARVDRGAGERGAATRGPVRESTDPGAQVRRTPAEQRSQGRRRHRPRGGSRAAHAQHPSWTAEDRQRRQLVASGERLAGEQQDDGAQQPPDDQAWNGGEQPPADRVGEEHEQGVPTVDGSGTAGSGGQHPTTGGGSARVAHPRGRYDDHPVSCGVDPPAEVEVVAEDRQLGVQAAQVVPHLPPDQRAGRAHGQDVPRAVVLALVVLAPLEAGHPVAGGVGGQTDLGQHPGVVPVDRLRAEKRCGRGGLGVLEQPLEGVAVRGAVVVQQPDPGRPRCHREGRRDSRAVPGGVGQGHDGAVGRAQVQDAVVAAAGVRADDPVGRDGLHGESREDLRQPARPVVADEDGGDAGAYGPSGEHGLRR